MGKGEFMFGEVVGLSLYAVGRGRARERVALFLSRWWLN